MCIVAGNPTVLRRQLGAELRRLREGTRHTVAAAAGVLGWSESKLSRIETAHIGIRRPKGASSRSPLRRSFCDGGSALFVDRGGIVEGGVPPLRVVSENASIRRGRAGLSARTRFQVRGCGGDQPDRQPSYSQETHIGRTSARTTSP